MLSNYVNVDDKFYFYMLNFLYNTYTLEVDSTAIRSYAGFALVNFVKNRNLGDRRVRCLESNVKSAIVW